VSVEEDLATPMALIQRLRELFDRAPGMSRTAHAIARLAVDVISDEMALARGPSGMGVTAMTATALSGADLRWGQVLDAASKIYGTANGAASVAQFDLARHQRAAQAVADQVNVIVGALRLRLPGGAR
jgi:hypothetical protein